MKRLFLTLMLALLSVTMLPAAVTYSTATKTARMTAVRDAIDGGAGAGKLVIGTSSLSGATGVLATITLNDPSGTVSGLVLTLSGFPKTVAASATGTAALAALRTSADTDIVTGLTVATSAADIIVDNTSINSGQNVTVNSFTITHARLNPDGPTFKNDPELYKRAVAMLAPR